jgi:putative NADH-flavin reductase
MKITLLGASGKIGSHLLDLALKDGHDVVAYVRDSSKIKVSHPHLTTVEGELNNIPRLKSVIEKSDVVVSTLGPPLKRTYHMLPVYDGHKAVMSLMKWSGVKRFITIGTPSIRFSEDKASLTTTIPGLIAKFVYPKPHKEVISIGEVVKQSELDWTVVRFITPVDKETKPAKVTFGDSRISFTISRKRIAEFLFQEITTPQYVHSMPIIGS